MIGSLLGARGIAVNKNEKKLSCLVRTSILVHGGR